MARAKSNPMNLHLLGTGGYHPSPKRQTACLMIPEAGIVFDAGTAFFRVRHHLQTPHLRVFLSHSHLDHCCGLTYLLDVLYGRDMQEVTLYGRESDLEVVKKQLFSSPLFPLEFTYGSRVLEESVTLGDWMVSTRQQKHPGGSLGFRLTGPGRSVAYITDTTADPEDEAACAFIRGVQVLVHECYFTEEYLELARRSGHSHASAVGAFAQRAGVGELVLVHVNPLADAAAEDKMLREVRAHFPRARIAYDQEILPL